MAGEDKKILIIVYYWPPSGGSGVQRWVKLAKYLVGQGIQVHVLTVDEKKASYLQLDQSLLEEVDPGILVTKTSSFEIINVFARIFGKKKVPTAGFYNLDKKSLVHNLGLIIRSNLFIPDPRRGWNSFAYDKALEIIQREGIRKVITTSPPHSSQLIGLKLKKKLKIEWTADLRDPWTDIFYYPLLKHSALSRRIDRNYEKMVLLNADHILTVSKGLKEVFTCKDSRIDPDKIHIIPNGFDSSDFDGLKPRGPGKDFVIGYTGTISEQYEPWGFLRAFSKFLKQGGEKARLEITGTIAPSITSFIEQLGIGASISINPPVPHKDIPAILSGKSALLLVIPKVTHAELILTGKLFEYLAARRPVILIGPEKGDAASIIAECESGASFGWDDESEITNHLQMLKKQHDEGVNIKAGNNYVEKYSRSAQAKEIKNILFPGKV